MHVASHVMLFARTSGDDGAAKGITCFLVPADDPGVKIEEYMWTFNMPTDHPRVSFTNIWVPESAIFGEPENGLALAQHFVHENRIRQAASGVGAAQYCIDQSVAYAKKRAFWRKRPIGRCNIAPRQRRWPLGGCGFHAQNAAPKPSRFPARRKSRSQAPKYW